MFYASVLAGARMPNLMYMTTFENQAERDAHWKTFGDDPGVENPFCKTRVPAQCFQS